jgi:iron(III) transport system permease protein
MVLMMAYPVALLFLKSFSVNEPGQPTAWGLGGWITAFNDRTLLSTLANTFSLALVRIAITTVVAIFFAWVVTRTDTPFKGFIEFMLWLGFFLPLLPMTMGWILLLEPQYGLLNHLFMKPFNLGAPPFDIFSYWGIVWCHLAFSTSIRFLLMTPAFRTMDAVLEEAAQISGSNSFGTLLRITLPILAPAILTSTSLGFIKSLESFEIELVLGVPAGIYVLSTRIFDFAHLDPPVFSAATALASIFLFMIFVLIWFQHVLLKGRQYTTITGRGYTVRIISIGPWRWVTFALCMLFIFVMIVLPVGALLMATFMRVIGFYNLENAWTTYNWATAFDDPIFLRSLFNTLYLGVGASIGGTFIYAGISYFIVRTKFAGRKIVDFLSWLPWALPGVLIGIALLWTVLGSGDLIRMLYGTILAMILGIVIREMPIGTQILKAGMVQISDELEEVSTVSGASWLGTFRRIILPLLSPALLAVGLVVFITAVRDIPTMVFLSTYGTRTVSLLMLDAIADSNMERAAVIGIFIVCLIVVLALLARMLGLDLSSDTRG